MRYDVGQMWSITDAALGARTIEETTEMAQLPKSKRKHGVQNTPIFRTIPLHHVVIDNLHMFLRVADTLIDLLIVEMRRLDALDKTKKLSSFDRGKAKHLAGWETFIDSLAIPNAHFYIDKMSKELKYRTLTGPEKIRVFENIQISTLLPNHLTLATKIQSLWKEFLKLHTILSKPTSDSDTSLFGDRAKVWLEQFLDIYQTRYVTPYIHAMVSHVPEFLQLYGTIVPFTQQGLEKLNDITTKEYFRASNHQKEAALCQIMLKRNRIEHLMHITDHLYGQKTCSVCGDKGHNMRTCKHNITTVCA